MAVPKLRNAKRLKCGKAVRNGPKSWDPVSHFRPWVRTKMRNRWVRNVNRTSTDDAINILASQKSTRQDKNTLPSS
jgi:hypothetical protein